LVLDDFFVIVLTNTSRASDEVLKITSKLFDNGFGKYQFVRNKENNRFLPVQTKSVKY